MRADVRQPTQWPTVFWRRAIGAAHRSGVAVRFGSSARAHMGHAGRRCRMDGASGRRDVHVGGNRARRWTPTQQPP
jgi:hypothetical protein